MIDLFVLVLYLFILLFPGRLLKAVYTSCSVELDKDRRYGDSTTVGNLLFLSWTYLFSVQENLSQLLSIL